jgi:hypothetical protein
MTFTPTRPLLYQRVTPILRGVVVRSPAGPASGRSICLESLSRSLRASLGSYIEFEEARSIELSDLRPASIVASGCPDALDVETAGSVALTTPDLSEMSSLRLAPGTGTLRYRWLRAQATRPANVAVGS